MIPKNSLFKEPIFFGRDPAPQSTNESTSDIIDALTKYLPGYMQAQNAQVLPQAQAELGAAQQISPEYAKLANELYKVYGPQFAQTGADLDRINRLGSAGTDLAILQGPGGQLASEAQKIDRQLNPEFYNTRELEARKQAELLGSINLNDPNPEAERLVNQENIRSGNLSNPSATGTVANALSFGNEEAKRRDQLGAALNQATQFLQPSQGQFNPVVTALNRPSSNTGQNQFTGVNKPTDQAYQTGSQLSGQIAQIGQQRADITANKRDALDRINDTTTAAGSVIDL